MSPEIALNRISPMLSPFISSVVRNGKVGLDATNCLRITDLKSGSLSQQLSVKLYSDYNLTEVQALVEQGREKTTNIQALVHGTVGQSLPAPLKRLFPSVISITWPLLFFEYEGSYVQRFSGQSKARCIESLLQAIHFPQPLSDDVRAAPISRHVQVAHEKEKVIPAALLSLLQSCSITEAKARLAAAPLRGCQERPLWTVSEAHHPSPWGPNSL